MVTLITHGVKITVQTKYEDLHSKPEEHYYLFSYKITIENNTLFYNGVAIKTLPSDALVRYKLKVKEMELEQKEDRLVYKIKYEENRKILGMFKAKAEHNAEIDTDDGNNSGIIHIFHPYCYRVCFLCQDS